MSPAMIISHLLHEDLNLGLVEATNLFIGRELPTPDLCCTVYDTGGGAQESRLALDEATFQIRVRATSYSEGYEKILATKVALQSFPSVNVDGIVVVGVWVNSNITFLKRDELDRSIFVWNGKIITKPLTSIYRL